MKEPIEYFTGSYGFDRKRIAEWTIGDKYAAIMNTDGHIGVCATLGTAMDDSLFKYGDPDTGNPCHRIILNAYFNSICNYERDYSDIKDIFDSIDFSTRHRLVMVGYFESLYRKFHESDIPLQVFDIHKESNILSDLSTLEHSLSEAETIILSGTTIFNNTFSNILKFINPGCDVFLLGPSNILSEEMFKYPGIKVVFGSVFARNDHRVLDIIGAGHGTRKFLPFLKKVYIVSNAFRHEIR
jgi:uncharacterized protein (DUF4213/DUF364 family)